MNIVTAKANLSFMINKIKGEKTDIKQIRRCEIESLEFAISALEKQIPKKVRDIGMNQSIGTKIGSCPMCDGRPLRECDSEYCPDCGQKLDWEVEQ